MSLGLAKDSMLNLAEMAQKKEDEHADENSTPDSLPSVPLAVEPDAPQTAMPLVATITTVSKEAGSEGGMTPQSSVNQPAGIDSDSHIGSTSVIPKDSTRSLTSEDSEANSQLSTTIGSYSGFSTDYAEYQHYGDYSLYGTPPVLMETQKTSGLWCCFFPWMNTSLTQGDNSDTHQPLSEDDPTKTTVVRSSSKEDDEVSTSSDIFGEKLSDKDRQAVLARLRLVQPESSAPANELPASKQKGLLNGIVDPYARQTSERDGPPRGILKRGSSFAKSSFVDESPKKGSSTDSVDQGRRSLFPQYDSKAKKPKKDLNVSFSPMARVVTVKSKNDMDHGEKGCIWWQKSDYEDFRRTGRLITKAMLEGGSEIWLAANKSWQVPEKNKASTLKYAYSLSERQKQYQTGSVARRDYEEARSKWWHAFGHSRRGLEHIASIDEGRQRQTNVRTAIRAVLDEQRRQKVFHREDPEKLRVVSLQNTSWARDLAIASGQSDADAVESEFDEEARKSREFYLLKMAKSNQATCDSSNVRHSCSRFCPHDRQHQFESIPTNLMQIPHLKFVTLGAARASRQ